jgi:hypothetical protein
MTPFGRFAVLYGACLGMLYDDEGAKIKHLRACGASSKYPNSTRGSGAI